MKKTPHIKYEHSGGQRARGTQTGADANGDSTLLAGEDEEFLTRKQKWQEELEGMSDFLQIKSTEEQREEGVEQPVDTAFVEEKDGMPLLKAVFDVHYFKPEEVQIQVENDQLIIEARATDDREDAMFRKTMIRKIDLPKHVDSKLMHCSLSKDGRFMTVEMPFHLPPQRRPEGPNVVPITTGPDGRRRIRLAFMIGPEFTSDDITIENKGKKLLIRAAYNEDVGCYGTEVSAKELKREYQLPDYLEAEEVKHVFSPDGRLFIEILLKKEPAYKCELTREDMEVTSST